ncbi:MAG: hypothetical protein PHR35_05045 [Kiritimatiellae bacterium]|nr:hypothetical protein [Kiritimatiellia bacterium]
MGWRSPKAGKVSIGARVTHGGPRRGSKGFEWLIVHQSKDGAKILANSELTRGRSMSLPVSPADQKLPEVVVAAGDLLAMVISSRGDHTCDSASVNLCITEIGGKGRTWDLAKDVVDSIQAGNPHADGLGNPGVWNFCSVAANTWPRFVCAPPIDTASPATTAREFRKELAAKGFKTIRQRAGEHSEQSWKEAMAAHHRSRTLPPHPKPAAGFEPAMRVEVPCERLTAQWNLGSWYILRRSQQDKNGKWSFNDYPYGVLAAETHLILEALDMQGRHKEAADGLNQWLLLPPDPGYPTGLFSDGKGCLTNAKGPAGAGGHSDGRHPLGAGAIMLAMSQHYRLTGDVAWLKANAPRMKANAEWILRQRQLLAGNIPGGQRLWSKGLQPAHILTTDGGGLLMQFYITEAYYWLAVKNMAEMLAAIDAAEGARMAAEAEAYRKDLAAAVERSIALSPVVQVRDGTYRSVIPPCASMRGLASQAWGWRRRGSDSHYGPLAWDTVPSAAALINPAGVLSANDRRVQGFLDVLEDRLLLENGNVLGRYRGSCRPEDQWFSYGSWQHQCGLERHVSIHLQADDAPNFLRSMLNQYAVDMVPGEYTFMEHPDGGPLDKIFEGAAFIERFRQMLVMEDGQSLWLARATPRDWLRQDKKISVTNAPTFFGTLAYEIVSDVDNGKIAATVQIPARNPPKSVFLRLRHPQTLSIKSVKVNGKPWVEFNKDKELIELISLTGSVGVVAKY